MPIADAPIHLQAVAALVGRTPQREFQNLRQLEEWYRWYATTVVGAALRASRTTLLRVYGHLELGMQIFTPHMASPTSQWGNQNEGTIKAYATVSTLLFIVLSFVKRRCKATREIILMLDEPWHRSLLEPRLAFTLMGGIIRAKLDIIWSRFDPHSPEMMQAVNYLLRHARGPARWYYPGFAHRLHQRGLRRGRPRWPARLVAHVVCMVNSDTQGAEQLRYRVWERLGAVYLSGCPVFLGSIRDAFNREQHIIRNRAPPTVARDSLPRREPRDTLSARNRPLPSARRRRRKLAATSDDSTVPPLAHNFNRCSLYFKQHIMAITNNPFQKVRNYATMYANWSRTLTTATATVSAPLDPRERGNEKLMAEYQATPGKRFDRFAPYFSNRRLLALSSWIPNIVSTYRRGLLKKKMCLFHANRRLPPPVQYRLTVRRSQAFLLPMVKAVARTTIAFTRRIEPEKAAFTSAYLAHCVARDHKLSQSMISEYEALESFNYWEWCRLAPEDIEHEYMNAAAVVLPGNWDVVNPPSRQETFEETVDTLARWSRHFHLGFDKNFFAKTLRQKRFWNCWKRLPENPVPPREIPECTLNEPATCGRLDKEEHVMIYRSLRGYHAALYKSFCQDATTFERMRHTPRQCARYVRTLWYALYPRRFPRHKPTFNVSTIPRVVSRLKSKCSSPDGKICCTKEGHVHERVIVNTAFVPYHFQDRLFSRGWEVVKRLDPAPSQELWALSRLFEQHRRSRGALRFLPEYLITCARCGCGKPGIHQARYDCVSMFTHADVMRIVYVSAPALLRWAAHRTNRAYVTVRKTKTVEGRLGGHPDNNFMQVTFHHHGLLQHLLYIAYMNIYMMGSGPTATCWRQIRGTAMGGRLSKAMMSIGLGEGESRMWEDEAYQRRHGYWLPGYRLEHLLSLIRQVDDGSVVTLVWCAECTLNFLRLCWGRDHKITLEDEGSGMRFIDTIERRHGFQFVLTPSPIPQSLRTRSHHARGMFRSPSTRILFRMFAHCLSGRFTGLGRSRAARTSALLARFGNCCTS